jgi:hypothetical protein
MLLALLPHGPVELAAYSLALYMTDRRRNLPAAYVATVAVVCVALLAIASVLEDLGERMRPGRTLLALAVLAAGVGISVPLLASSLHKLGAQGWFHSGATKGGLIQPATPTPDTTPVTGLLRPRTPAPAAASKTATTAHAHSAAGHGGQPLLGPGSRPRSSSRSAPARRQPPAGARPIRAHDRPADRTVPRSSSHGPSGGALGDPGALLATALEIVAGIALVGVLAVGVPDSAHAPSFPPPIRPV